MIQKENGIGQCYVEPNGTDMLLLAVWRSLGLAPTIHGWTWLCGLATVITPRVPRPETSQPDQWCNWVETLSPHWGRGFVGGLKRSVITPIRGNGFTIDLRKRWLDLVGLNVSKMFTGKLLLWSHY